MISKILCIALLVASCGLETRNTRTNKNVSAKEKFRVNGVLTQNAAAKCMEKVQICYISLYALRSQINSLELALNFEKNGETPEGKAYVVKKKLNQLNGFDLPQKINTCQAMHKSCGSSPLPDQGSGFDNLIHSLEQGLQASTASLEASHQAQRDQEELEEQMANDDGSDDSSDSDDGSNSPDPDIGNPDLPKPKPCDIFAQNNGNGCTPPKDPCDINIADGVTNQGFPSGCNPPPPPSCKIGETPQFDKDGILVGCCYQVGPGMTACSPISTLPKIGGQVGSGYTNDSSFEQQDQSTGEGSDSQYDGEDHYSGDDSGDY